MSRSDTGKKRPGYKPAFTRVKPRVLKENLYEIVCRTSTVASDLAGNKAFVGTNLSTAKVARIICERFEQSLEGVMETIMEEVWDELYRNEGIRRGRLIFTEEMADQEVDEPAEQHV